MMTPAPLDSYRSVCLTAADAILPSEVRIENYLENDFGLDAHPTPGFNARLIGVPLSLRCDFPGDSSAQIGHYPILGTALPFHSIFRSIETASLSVLVEGDEMPSRSLEWPDLAQHPGLAKMQSSNLTRLLKRGHQSSTLIARFLAKSSPRSSRDARNQDSDQSYLGLDLLSGLDAVMLPFLDQQEDRSRSAESDGRGDVTRSQETDELMRQSGIWGGPMGQGMHSRVVLVLTISLAVDPKAADAAENLNDLRFDGTIVAPERRGVVEDTDSHGEDPDGALLVVAVSLSGTVRKPELAEHLARQAQKHMQVSCELASAQVLLLRAIAKLRRYAEDQIEYIQERPPATITPATRAETAYQFVSLEAFAKRVIESGWCLNEPGYVNDRLLHLVDDKIGLTSYWQSECQRLGEMCRLGALLLDHRAIRDARNVGDRRNALDLSERPSIFIVDRWRRPGTVDEQSSVGIESKRPLLERLVGGYSQLAKLEGEAAMQRRPRLVEFHPFSRLPLIAQSISGRLTTATMMTATSGLLLGLLVGDGSVFSDSITGGVSRRPPPIDILLLFVSTFSFFFETLMLAYASRCISFSTVGIVRLTERASDVSTYLGQYSFVVALPLAVSRLIGRDGLEGDTLVLSISICSLAMAFLIIYFRVLQAGSFALLSNPKVGKTDSLQYCVFSPRERSVIFAVLDLMSALLFLSTVLQLANVGPDLGWMMWPVAIGLIVMLLALVVLGWRLAGIVELRYFEVDEWDLMGSERSGFE